MKKPTLTAIYTFSVSMIVIFVVVIIKQMFMTKINWFIILICIFANLTMVSLILAMRAIEKRFENIEKIVHIKYEEEED